VQEGFSDASQGDNSSKETLLGGFELSLSTSPLLLFKVMDAPSPSLDLCVF
jgi:hypothetical protein